MLKGKGISDGIGLGTVVLLKKEEIKPEKVKVEEIQTEKEIFQKALHSVQIEIQELIGTLSGTEKEIMQAYVTILQDPTLVEQIIAVIEQEKCNAAYATEIGFGQIIQMLEKIEDSYLAARSKDIADMKKKVLAKILQQEERDVSQLPKNTILVTKELTTSDTAKLDLKNIAGIITQVGIGNSHMAIMARIHEIPAIVIKEEIKQMKENDVIAMNGATGEIFINPSQEERNKLEEIQKEVKKQKEQLQNYKNQKSSTIDGHTVELLANIGGTEEMDTVLKNTAEGVGLFRSEFLYMNSKDFPSEEEQFESYRKVAEKLQGKRAVIRTLDIGGDKDLKYMKLPKEKNPFLGYRAIRIYLDNVSLFKVQLRAILRASAYGNLAIMLPMISSIEELRKAKNVIEEVKEELRTKQKAFREKIEVGIMIEIPSAAIMAEELAKECDFFSIGTNDLVQYTIAVERGNEKVESLYTHFHPAVIRFIKLAIEGAHKSHILCGMCGEAAGDLDFIPILIGLGLDEFSMNANKILPARKWIKELDFKSCQKLAEEVLSLSSTKEIKQKVKNYLLQEGNLRK